MTCQAHGGGQQRTGTDWGRALLRQGCGCSRWRRRCYLGLLPRSACLGLWILAHSPSLRCSSLSPPPTLVCRGTVIDTCLKQRPTTAAPATLAAQLKWMLEQVSDGV